MVPGTRRLALLLAVLVVAAAAPAGVCGVACSSPRRAATACKGLATAEEWKPSAVDRRTEVWYCSRCHGFLGGFPAFESISADPKLASYPSAALPMSACYQESATIRCRSCHGLERPRPTHIQVDGVCMGCHREVRDVSALLGPGARPCTAYHDAECSRCHMEAVAGKDGKRVTHHWIRREGGPLDRRSLLLSEAVQENARRLVAELDLAVKDEAAAAAAGHPGLDEGILAQTLVNLAVARDMTGKRDEAVDAMLRATRVQPKNFLIFYNLGNLYLSQQKTEEAIEAFRKALFLEPDHVMSHIRLAVAFIEMGGDEPAQHELEEAIRIEPDNALAWFYLGGVHLSLGKPPEAVEAYRKALALKPDLTMARQNLAVALMRAGRTEEAREVLAELARVSPRDPLSRNALEFFDLGPVVTRPATEGAQER